MSLLAIKDLYLVVLIRLHSQCVPLLSTVSGHLKPVRHYPAYLNYWKAVKYNNDTVYKNCFLNRILTPCYLVLNLEKIYLENKVLQCISVNFGYFAG